jgi:hypothetical protein
VELDRLKQDPLPHITIEVGESDLSHWNVTFEVRLSILLAGSLREVNLFQPFCHPLSFTRPIADRLIFILW